ncbi:MAG: histidinol-phosphate transaminase [Clostridia bacterium]|nr:histidinol-phosphate transaminase [Clostridia bacterium]
MSAYFSEKYSSLTPYTPGEQPKDTVYIKLNTNESPYPPSERAQAAAAEAAGKLNLYPDPECYALTSKLAEILRVDREEVLLTNGSDEILNFAFMAYCDESHPAVFPDITYGFYKVFAQINNVPCETIPLKDDLTINVADYIGINKTIFIANPNAPTGLALTRDEIEEIVKSNPDNVVVIDEAYIDFGGESAVPLIKKYGNLLVTQTFSKSRSMAGARLGFGVGCKELIRDLNTIKYSTNPYNINMMTMAAGLGMLEDESVTRERCALIRDTRAYTLRELRRLGFEGDDSETNFVFVRHPKMDGKKYYTALRENGILVRHFDTERLREYNRITIGTRCQMERLIEVTEKILEESL